MAEGGSRTPGLYSLHPCAIIASLPFNETITNLVPWQVAFLADLCTGRQAAYVILAPLAGGRPRLVCSLVTKVGAGAHALKTSGSLEAKAYVVAFIFHPQLLVSHAPKHFLTVGKRATQVFGLSGHFEVVQIGP